MLLGKRIMELSRATQLNKFAWIISFFALLIALYACSNESGAGKSQRDLAASNELYIVKVSKVKRGNIASFISATGTLLAKKESKLSANVSAKIDEIYVNEGDRIEKGQKLVKLEQTDFLLKVKEAEAQLETAWATLKKILAGTREEDVEKDKAAVNEAKADRDNAELEFKRMEDLWKKGIVGKSLYDKAFAQYEASVARLKKAQEQLQSAVRGATQEDIDIAKAMARELEVKLEKAKQELKDTIIYAPYDGVLVEKYADVGSRVTATPVTNILSIMDISTLEVEAGLAENKMGSVRVEDRAQVEIAGFDGQIPGRVSAVSYKVDPMTRTFKVKIEVENKDYKLKAGAFARVKITVREAKNSLLIPKNALLESGGGRAVMVVNDGAAKIKKIQTGIVSDNLIEVISSGLSEGEDVVIEGFEGIGDGSKVRVIE